MVNAATGMEICWFCFNCCWIVGEWNLLKIFLYSSFSFIISLMILFAKVWQHSTSLGFKTHLAFLVLTITSVYSFYFDKTINRKSDAYGLISCAAFVIMSPSLSRQTHWGIEVDHLYFFLGSLIVQLMKIKLLLAIVGAGFSYSLIIHRSSLDASSETEYLGLQDHVVIQVDSQQANNGSAIQVDSTQANTGSALIIMPQQVDSHSQQANTESALIMPQLMACINALKKNNRNLISMLSNHVDKYLKADVNSNDKDQIPVLQTDHNLVIDALPSEIINDLHETVKLVVSAGFEKECCHVYSSCRREFLQECLSRFGLQKLGMEDVDKMDLVFLQFRIRKWIQASNVSLRILFPIERRLCDRVFFGFSSAADLSFMEVCRELTFHLLNFAHNFATGSRSPTRLRNILKVLKTLRDLIPEFESLFSDQYSVSLMNEGITIRKRLGEAIKGIFIHLQKLIRHDTAQAAVPGGGLHPITRYVMNCLSAIFEARDTLEQVFKEYPMVAVREESSSSLSVQMAWIIELLESNLEAKSNNYTDPALGYVSMMNNVMYIEEMAKLSELGTILGYDWIRKRTAKVRQNLEHYQRSSWDKVLDLLKLDNNVPVAPNVTVDSMKEKLNLFNLHFNGICTVQSSWFLLDNQLRIEIRISLEKILLPQYGDFIRRFQNVLGKHADEYIEYGIFDIRARLGNLFRGSSG